MIELVIMLLASINGTDDNDDDWMSDYNSTRSGCDYYGTHQLMIQKDFSKFSSWQP